MVVSVTLYCCSTSSPLISSHFHNALPVPSSSFARLATPLTLTKTSNHFLGLPLLSGLDANRYRYGRKHCITTMSMEAGIGVMGTKLGMMTYFEPEGKVVPVTVFGFRDVMQVKTVATDGYNAVQVGYRMVRDKKLTRPELGHLNKIGTIPMRHLQEFQLVSVDGFEPSQKLVLEDIFKEGDLVDVSGNSIGKGFQGGIKRHNFHRGPMTHGSKSHRA